MDTDPPSGLPATPPVGGSVLDLPVRAPVKVKRDDGSDTVGGPVKKKKKPLSEPTDDEVRAWAQHNLQVTWRDGDVLEVSGRPRAQFSTGEGTHTVAWTVVDRAVQANLSKADSVATAIDRLRRTVTHLKASPLAALERPTGQTERRMQGTDVTVQASAEKRLTASLAAATDRPGLAKAVKDFLVWRNTLPFASIQGYAIGASEGTYASLLAGHEARLQVAGRKDGRALPDKTREQIRFAAWRLLDTAALFNELTPKEHGYDDDTATGTTAAVVATLLDEVSRWAPLALRSAGLLTADKDPLKRAGTVVESLKSYFTAESALAEEEEKRQAEQWERESSGLSGALWTPGRGKSDALKARSAWLASHEDALKKRLADVMDWVGAYGFGPTHVTRTVQGLSVPVAFVSGRLEIDISGRPVSPYTGSEGSHTTAWEVERLATVNRLSGKTRPEVAKELRKMLEECGTTPAAGLVELLPEEERAVCAYLTAKGKKQLGDAIDELAGAADPLPAIARAVQGYQDFRNALPFATTFAGSRDSHGEGAVLKKAGTLARPTLSKALFDKQSLDDEIEYLGLEKERDRILEARQKEHARQFERAFPRG